MVCLMASRQGEQNDEDRQEQRDKVSVGEQPTIVRHTLVAGSVGIATS